MGIVIKGRTIYGPNIVTDGLVLYLDAANPKSYPGSGTTWYDLSGNASNVTLINSPTFDATNKGSIVFDGNNDYTANMTKNLFIKGSMTYEIAFKPISNNANGPLGSSDVTSTMPYFYLDYGGGNIRTYHFGTAPQYHTIESISTGSIYHVCCTRNNLTETNYVNGILGAGRILSNDSGYNDGFGSVGGYAGLNWYINCNVYFIRIYNRTLSTTEILQNYNAMKGRYL